jgi:acetoin utilization protein AcuB
MPTLLVGDHMTRSPHTVGRTVTLAAAHDLMRSFHIRHLPVLEEGRLVGIVSQGDLHLIETLRDVAPEQVLVEEAMTDDPFVAAPDAPLAQVVRQMAERRHGSVVVVEGRTVVGLFTTTDAMRVLLELLEDKPAPLARPAHRRVAERVGAAKQRARRKA